MTSHAQHAQPTLIQDILYLLIKIAIIIVIFAIVLTFIFGALRYNADNMKPSISEGDLVLFYRLDRQFSDQDVVLFKQAQLIQVQRIVAIGGDVVDITADGLMVNGALKEETHVYAKTKRYASTIQFPYHVPKGQVFVMSDNREQANDSRIYGAVSEKKIIGKVICVIRRRNI